MDKINIKSMIYTSRTKKKETKQNKSVRIKPKDLDIVVKTFGSLQKALDALVEQLRGKK